MLTEARLRHTALFLVPLALLGVSPRQIPYAIIVVVGYAIAALLLRTSSIRFTIGWVYALGACLYLVVAMSLVPSLNHLGSDKGIFLVAFILPLGLAVSYLVEKARDVRFILGGFVATALVLATISITLETRAVLGVDRYQWQGNLNAIAAVALLQLWLIRRKAIAIPLAIACLAGVAVAAAKQSVGVVAIGVTAIMLGKLLSGRRGTADAIWITVMVSTLVIFRAPIGQLPIMSTMLERLGALQTPTGSYSFLQRQLLFGKAWQCFLDHPTSGIGIGEFVNLSGWTAENIGEVHEYPHNTMLEILCEQGLVGFSFLMVPLIVAALYMFVIGSRPGNEAHFATLLLFLAGATMANLTGDLSTRPMWIFGLLMLRLGSMQRDRMADSRLETIQRRSRLPPVSTGSKL